MDLIERQAAIEACLKGKTDGLTATIEACLKGKTDGLLATNVACDCCAERIRVLPSAQPEIVRCEECKHANGWHKGKKAWCDGWDNVVFKGDYCSYAERRTE